MSARKEHMWRCECGGGHFISLTLHPDSSQDLDFEGYFYIEGDFRSSWRHRIAQAWRIIRHGHEDSWVGILLSPGKARSLIAALQEYLGETGS